MLSLLSQAVDAVRVLLGLNDPAENRLHASHGWLLPPSSELRDRVLGVPRALTLAPAPATAPGRRQ